jgi:Asp-tRNA(Asn)/Glu-tRNA(Gln) amidotransferase A subunit family amidase
MLSVISIQDEIATGRRTPEATVEESLDRIARLDGAIGAFAALADRQALLAAARTAAGPLAGVPVGIKDIFDTADMPTGYGTAIYEGHRPRSDAAVVSMIRAGGAAILGKTVTTEFAFLDPAGTRNPRDASRTPGGSSSGSAAAVGAGMIAAATGTQTGGSVIRPAAYCGVSGYKPSFRLVPTVGAKAFSWSLDTVGFFAASAADVARFAAAVTGRDLDVVEPPSPPRLGIYRSRVWSEAEPAMRAALDRAAALAANAGATVSEIAEPNSLSEARDCHSTVQNFEAGLALADDFLRHGDRMSAILRETLASGRALTPADYDRARSTARQARKEATALFTDVDVLLTPSAPGPAPAGLGSTGSPIFNKLWTLTGNPCVNVTGFDGADGLPLGLQVVARFGADRMALSAAAWLERLVRAA